MGPISIGSLTSKDCGHHLLPMRLIWGPWSPNYLRESIGYQLHFTDERSSHRALDRTHLLSQGLLMKKKD